MPARRLLFTLATGALVGVSSVQAVVVTCQVLPLSLRLPTTTRLLPPPPVWQGVHAARCSRYARRVLTPRLQEGASEDEFITDDGEREEVNDFRAQLLRQFGDGRVQRCTIHSA